MARLGGTERPPVSLTLRISYRLTTSLFVILHRSMPAIRDEYLMKMIYLDIYF
jgi:hypothetical protein